MLLSLPNSELLLAPLRQNEAVVSSRMEGTISTVDEVMVYEAESGDEGAARSVRDDVIEAALYSSVLRRAQASVADGEPINEGLIKNAHRILLGFGRGARKVSRDDDWTSWIAFFLRAIAEQAEVNLNTTKQIMALYEEMKEPFREISGSKWHLAAQDFIFEFPVFKNSHLIRRSGMPRHVATRITRLLNQNDLLRELRPASGRRGALFMFEPLMQIVRA